MKKTCKVPKKRKHALYHLPFLFSSTPLSSLIFISPNPSPRMQESRYTELEEPRRSLLPENNRWGTPVPAAYIAIGPGFEEDLGGVQWGARGRGGLWTWKRGVGRRCRGRWCRWMLQVALRAPRVVPCAPLSPLATGGPLATGALVPVQSSSQSSYSSSKYPITILWSSCLSS